jgi:hypothetical protein
MSTARPKTTIAKKSYVHVSKNTLNSKERICLGHSETKRDELHVDVLV